MDKHITELNGKIFYMSIWAVIGLLIIFSFYWYYRKKARQKCSNCGKPLAGERRYKDVYKGMPKTYCGSKCAEEFKKNGKPLSAEQQLALRSEEALKQST